MTKQFFTKAKKNIGRPTLDDEGLVDINWYNQLPEEMRPREEWREGEPPLTDAEVAAWVNALAPTDTERLVVLRSLLRYANQDQMSKDDREICKKEIRRLQEKLHGPAVKTDRRFKGKVVARIWEK